MTIPGEHDRPAPSIPKPELSSGDTAPPRISDGEAPWLTESAYAWPNAETREHSQARQGPTLAPWVRRMIFALVVLVPLSILALGVAVYREARAADPQQADAIVVLGAAQFNGRPSRVFQARLDHALTLYDQGYAPVIVVTGGKMPGDAYTEAETAELYLIDRGVPASSILSEQEGRDTWQSMQGVADVLEGRGVDSLLIVSDGYHLLRSRLMAEDLGFNVSASAAPDSPIRPWSALEFSYVIREVGGIIALVPELLGQTNFPIRP